MKINRMIALICAFALCISLLPTVGTRVEAYSAHTADEAINWLNSLLNQKVGTGQCVALIKAYYSYLGVSAVNGHAYTYATDTAKVPSGWSRIEGATPQKGDVMIWTGGPEGYGHVAICGGDGIYFHQNFSGHYVEIRTSSYIPSLNYKSGEKAPYWGVIRPDFSTSSQAVTVPEPSNRAIASGNYMIKNAGSTDYFMNVYAGKDANGTKVVTWTIDTATDDQHFWFSHQGNGAYFIYAVGLTNRVLDIYYGSDSAISIGDYLQVWTKGADDNSSLFNVVPVGNNKFVFELKYMNDAVLTMNSASNNGAITLQKYTGSDAQHWYICDYSGSILGTCNLLGHSYTGTIETPTCTEQGCTTYVCTTCGDSYTDDYVVATGHSYTGITQAPNCTEQGYTDYVCENCGDSYTADIVEATGHNYESVITEPTVDSQGYTTHTCTVCGYSYVDSYTDQTTQDGLRFKVQYDKVTITGYVGSDKRLEIPSVINGYPVTTIGSYAFSGCTELTRVTIPDSVTSIGDNAFAYCESLMTVTLGNGVKEIYDSAFSNCYKLIAITIPNSVTYIGNNAFYNCSILASVTMGTGVTSIGDSAFSNCGELTYIAIPDSVTGIGEDLFRNCRNLTRATIGNGVTSISDGIFDGCWKLAGVVIGDNVTSIGKFAFYNCDSLTNLTIPDSVTSIEEYAFYKCDNLTEIIIEYNVTSIGDYAFSGCKSLQKVYYADIEEQWKKISIGSNNDYLLNAEIIYLHIVSKQAASQWNISLLEDFGVNFYFNVSEYTAAKTEVEVVVGAEKSTYILSELPLTDTGYLLTVCLGAPEMAETITVTSTREGIGSIDTYSIRQYCDAILGDENYSQYHRIVKEMLNYGAMAQLYFNHNTENLANEGITGVATKEIPQSADAEINVTGHADGISFFGASLVYKEKIAMRYYYTTEENIFRYAFGTVIDSMSGIGYEPDYKNNMYYIQTLGILPQDLDEQIEVYTTNCDNGTVLNVSYSPMNYIVRMNQKGSEEAKALMKALYNYHLAAKAMCAETA